MNLVEIFNQYGIPHALAGESKHVRGTFVGVDCLTCSPNSGKFKLGFDQNSSRAVCWTCGKQDPAATLATLCRISIGEAIALLRSSPRAYTPRDETTHQGRLTLPVGLGPLLPAHRQYLKDVRRFDPDQLVKVWEIGGIGMAPELQWRIFIPIHDKFGKVVSWTTRAISDKAELRYVSAEPSQESVPHKSLIYGAHLTRHSIVVVEGPISAWGIGPGAGCTFGLSVTDKQMCLLAEYPVRAICFDNQPEAQRRAWRLCRDLSVMPGVTDCIRIESAKDTGDCDPLEIAEIRRKYLE